MATYTEKELEEITAKYAKDISFTELDSNNTYLIKVEFVNTSKERICQDCTALKNILSDKGIENVIIIPINTNSIVDLKLYKLEKDKEGI